MAGLPPGLSGTQTQRAAKPKRYRHGLAAFALGCGLAKWQIYDPLYSHEQGVEPLTVYFPMVHLAIILIVYGAARLALGERLVRTLELVLLAPRRLDWKGIVILMLFALITFVAWYWVRLQFWQHGYR